MTESSRDAIMKPSRRCTSDSFPTTMGNVAEFKIPNYYGNLCTPTVPLVTVLRITRYSGNHGLPLGLCIFNVSINYPVVHYLLTMFLG
jgi:hypothetical protein